MPRMSCTDGTEVYWDDRVCITKRPIIKTIPISRMEYAPSTDASQGDWVEIVEWVPVTCYEFDVVPAQGG